MIIQAFGERFEVIYAKGLESEYAVLQCRELCGGVEYTFLRFQGEYQIKSLLLRFLEMTENEDYRDFKGCFTVKEELYAAFYLRRGRTLSDLLENGNLPLERRILIGRRILEKFLLWTLPPYLAGQLLDLERILISEDEILFDYAWQAPVELKDDMTAVSQKAAKLMEVLLEKELKSGAGPEFMGFLERLKKGSMKDIFQIYEGYDQVLDTLPRETEINTVYLKLADKAQAIVKSLIVLAGYAAILIALFSGIWIREAAAEKEKDQGVAFEKIGTLEIWDDTY